MDWRVTKILSKTAMPSLLACWPCDWLLTGSERPRVMLDGRRQLAYRVMHEVFNGPLGKNLCCHSCDNPVCVNPAHLFMGTQTDNMSDRNRKRRQARGERHGQSKITPSVAAAIRNDTGTHRQLADKYGLHHTTIGAILRREIWNE